MLFKMALVVLHWQNAPHGKDTQQAVDSFKTSEVSSSDRKTRVLGSHYVHRILCVQMLWPVAVPPVREHVCAQSSGVSSGEGLATRCLAQVNMSGLSRATICYSVAGYRVSLRVTRWKGICDTRAQ